LLAAYGEQRTPLDRRVPAPALSRQAPRDNDSFNGRRQNVDRAARGSGRGRADLLDVLRSGHVTRQMENDLRLYVPDQRVHSRTVGQIDLAP
jgi:hypothetical protein